MKLETPQKPHDLRQAAVAESSMGGTAMRKRILRHPAAPRYPALADDHYPQMIPARVIAALLLAAIMIALAIRA